MQQPPGQQGPPQQSSSLDETGVAAVKVTSAAIKSKYFILSPVEVSLHLGRRSVPSRFWARIRRAAAEQADGRHAKRRSRSRSESVEPQIVELPVRQTECKTGLTRSRESDNTAPAEIFPWRTRQLCRHAHSSFCTFRASCDNSASPARKRNLAYQSPDKEKRRDTRVTTH
jgi:hypothetical protein